MSSVDSKTYCRAGLRYKRIFHTWIIYTALPHYITRYRSWSTDLTTPFAYSTICSSLHPVRDSTSICYRHDLKEKKGGRGKEMNSKDVQIPIFSWSRAGLSSPGSFALRLTQPFSLRSRRPAFGSRNSQLSLNPKAMMASRNYRQSGEESR
jgi:hypothetical protein